MTPVDKKHFLNFSVLSGLRTAHGSTLEDAETLFELHEFLKQRGLSLVSNGLADIAVKQDGRKIGHSGGII